MKKKLKYFELLTGKDAVREIERGTSFSGKAPRAPNKQSKSKEDSYYTKGAVYGTSPLKEIIYELEDVVQYDAFRDRRFVDIGDLDRILLRHSRTVDEFKNRLANLFD